MSFCGGKKMKKNLRFFFLAPGWAMVGGFEGPFLENLLINTLIFLDFRVYWDSVYLVAVKK
jgi:hypothetical protein